MSKLDDLIALRGGSGILDDRLIFKQAKAELVQMRALLQRAAVMLRELEWKTADELIAECPICGAFGEIPEHAGDCRLAALLKDLPS